ARWGSPRTRRVARFTTGVRARCSRTWWRRAAWVCVRSRYAEPRRWRAAFRSSRMARLSGPSVSPAQPRFRMAKSPRPVPTWRSKRRASVVGERASVRSLRQAPRSWEAPQQTISLFDHLVGTREHPHWKLVHWYRLVRCLLVGVLLDVDVDKVACTARRFEEIPALHPLIGALELVFWDRSRIDEIHAALTQVGDLEVGDLGILIFVVVDEVMHVRRLVRVNAPYCLAHSTVESAMGHGIDVLGSHFRTVMEGCNHGPATLFFGECDVGLGQGRSVDGAIHEHPETIGRA